jgi:hypothetical protein
MVKQESAIKKAIVWEMTLRALVGAHKSLVETCSIHLLLRISEEEAEGYSKRW